MMFAMLTAMIPVQGKSRRWNFPIFTRGASETVPEQACNAAAGSSAAIGNLVSSLSSSGACSNAAAGPFAATLVTAVFTALTSPAVLLLTPVAAATPSPASVGAAPASATPASVVAKDTHDVHETQTPVSADCEADECLEREFNAVLALERTPESTCLTLYRDHELLLNVKGGQSLVPASLMKIATAAAALEVMGPDAVYTTEVFANAEALASASDGVLRGDLYLLGSGDPVLSSPEYIRRWTQYQPDGKPYTDFTVLGDRVFASLADRGITRIEGRVFGDESWYPDGERDYSGVILQGEPLPLWKPEWVTTNLVGPLSGLMLNDGYSKYTERFRDWKQNVRAADPAQHTASEFDDLLEAHGMVITGRPRSGTAPEPADRESLGSVDSPPLSEITRRMLSRSDNTTAEMLLKEIGRRTTGSSRAQAVKGAQTALRRVLGPLAEDIAMADGSGLSYQNRMTCRAVARLLVNAGTDSPLVKGLAVAGSTGTLRSCGTAPPAGGRSTATANVVHAKTGRLNISVSLAGFTSAANGGTLAFAMIANDSSVASRIGSCGTHQKTLLAAARDYTYGPAPASGQFADTVDSVHEADIITLARTGITRGCSADGTLFCPDEVITRAQMASFLARAFALSGLDGDDGGGNGGLGGGSDGHGNDGGKKGNDDIEGGSADSGGDSSGGGGGAGYADVTTSSVHVKDIAAVAAAGVILECTWDNGGSGSGVLNGGRMSRFCPDAAVTRADMASFLTRALGLRGDADARFADVAEGSDHEEAISAISAAGITRGCSTDGPLFCPDSAVTRAQMASFIVRALKF